MCIDVSHLVLVALGHADDEVVDDRSYCSECSDVLAVSVVQLNVDNIFAWLRE